MDVPERFPKIKVPLCREKYDNKSFVTSTIEKDFDWIFNDETKVVEKLHGTNVAVFMEHGNVKKGAVRLGNREMNELNPFGNEKHQSVTRGIQNSINSGFLYMHNNDWVFGEVIGPNFHNNPYKLDKHLFIPFDWIHEHCVYVNFPKNSFDDILNWMDNEIYSIFKSRLTGKKPKNCSVNKGEFVEGVVFVKPSFNKEIKPKNLEIKKHGNYDSVAMDFAKIRRDMFEKIYKNENLKKFNL